MMNGPKVLCIAGVDNSGLAGLDQDLRTLSALNCRSVAVSTAKTQQAAGAEPGVAVAQAQGVREAIKGAIAHQGIAAVKIGMLGSPEMVAAVTEGLQHYPGPVVLDPVLKASSGLVLLPKNAWSALTALASQCTLVTPNWVEFDALGGEIWRAKIAVPVLLKGGHAEGERLVDRLIWPSGRSFQKSHLRLNLLNPRGTGCALSSAIACNLALGMTLQKAVSAGIDWQQASFRAQAVP